MHKKGGAKCCKCHGGRGRWGTSCYDSPENCCKRKQGTRKQGTRKQGTRKQGTRKQKTNSKKRKAKRTRKLFGLF